MTHLLTVLADPGVRAVLIARGIALGAAAERLVKHVGHREVEHRIA